MKIIVVALLLSGLAWAQNPNTAAYPGSVPNLPTASPSAQSNLAVAMDAVQTTATLVDASVFRTPLILAIGSERLLCTTKVGNVLSGCTRGFDGTTAAIHAINSIASAQIPSYLLNQLSAEVAAIGSRGTIAWTSGAGAPVGACAAPSLRNLNAYTNTTTGELWVCTANGWLKWLLVSDVGTYTVTGATGAAPGSPPPAGSVTCYYDSTATTQICLNPAGAAYAAVKTQSTGTANQFVDFIGLNAIAHTRPIVALDVPDLTAVYQALTGKGVASGYASLDGAIKVPIAQIPTTVVPQKFFGTAAPGSVAGNLPGDQFTDTTAHHQYVCNAPAGTAAPACTSVSTAGWLQVDGASGTPVTTVLSPSGPVLAGSGSTAEASSLVQVKESGAGTAAATTGQSDALITTPNCTNQAFSILDTAWSTDVGKGLAMSQCPDGSGVTAAGKGATTGVASILYPASQSFGWNFAFNGTAQTNGYATLSAVVPSGAQATSRTNTQYTLFGREDATTHYYDADINFRGWNGTTHGGGGFSLGTEGVLQNSGTLTSERLYLYRYADDQTIFFVDSTAPSVFQFGTGMNVNVGGYINVAGNLFSSSLRAPIITGGALVGSGLVLQSTEVAGTTDSISLRVGNNGATHALDIAHSGAITLSGTVNGTTIPTSSTLLTTTAGVATDSAKINGVAYPSSPALHSIPVITASNVATAKVLPPCVDSGGNHLNYDQSTDTWSCGTTSSGGGGSPGLGRNTLSITFTAMADGTCQAQTATWTGVATTDTLVPGWPSGLNAGLIGNMFVSATNTVTVRLCNFSGASVTPGSLSYAATLAIYNLAGAGTIDFASIPDGSCLASTFALTGVAAGDPVAAKWPSTLETGLIGTMRASATDTVEVRLCNFSGAAVNPASQSFGASVAK